MTIEIFEATTYIKDKYTAAYVFINNQNIPISERMKVFNKYGYCLEKNFYPKDDRLKKVFTHFYDKYLPFRGEFTNCEYIIDTYIYDVYGGRDEQALSRLKKYLMILLFKEGIYGFTSD